MKRVWMVMTAVLAVALALQACTVALGEWDFTADTRRHEFAASSPEESIRQNSLFDVNSYAQAGRSVEFSESAIASCVREYYKIRYGVPLTPELCDEVKDIYFISDGRNAIHSLVDLKLFPNLESVYIDNRGVARLNLTGLEAATHLRFLSLTACGISDFSPIAGMPSLEYLSISDADTAIQDISGISRLEKLRSLHLYARVESGSMSINTLKNLDELVLGNTLWNTYRSYTSTEISRFPLQDKISFSGLSNLKRLTVSLGDSDPSWVFNSLIHSGAASRLEYLDLGRTKLTTEQINQYSGDFQNLRYLRVRLEERQSLAGLSEMGSLQVANLVIGRDTEGIEAIAEMKGLRALRLEGGCPDKVIHSIGQLTQLRYLFVEPHESFLIDAIRALPLECLILNDSTKGSIRESIDVRGLASLKTLKYFAYSEYLRLLDTQPINELSNTYIQKFGWSGVQEFILPALRSYCELSATVMETKQDKDTYVTETLPDGTLKIVSYRGMDREVKIPETIGEEQRRVSMIGCRAFEGRENLLRVVIPESVTAIEGNPFAVCKWVSIRVDRDNPCFRTKGGVLYDIRQSLLVAYPRDSQQNVFTVPEGVQSIGPSAFAHNEVLEQVILPDSLLNIGDTAFGNCRSLVSVVIPGQVAYIGINPFLLCPHLDAIEVDPDNDRYQSPDGVLYDVKENSVVSFPNAKEDEYAIPDGVKAIGAAAFMGSGYLVGTTIPDSLEHIGHFAFAQCYSLGEIVIPAGVRAIEDYAFAGCSYLSRVCLDNGSVALGTGVFLKCSKTMMLSLLDGAKAITYARENKLRYTYPGEDDWLKD